MAISIRKCQLIKSLNYCIFKGISYLGFLRDFKKIFSWFQIAEFQLKMVILTRKWQFKKFLKIWNHGWSKKIKRGFLTWIFERKFLPDINWSTLLRRHTSYKIFFLTCALLSDLLCHLILKSRHFRNAINFIRIYVFLCKILEMLNRPEKSIKSDIKS